jgi:hypothetical protein
MSLARSCWRRKRQLTRCCVFVLQFMLCGKASLSCSKQGLAKQSALSNSPDVVNALHLPGVHVPEASAVFVVLRHLMHCASAYAVATGNCC